MWCWFIEKKRSAENKQKNGISGGVLLPQQPAEFESSAKTEGLGDLVTDL